MWLVRCQKKFENRQVDGAACLTLFKKRLRFRIAADFARFDKVKFAETWGRGETLCKVLSPDELEFKF